MDNKRTIESIQQEIDNLYQKTLEQKEKIKREKDALDFKLRVLEKVYLEKKQELEIEQATITEDEVRKELGL